MTIACIKIIKSNARMRNLLNILQMLEMNYQNLCVLFDELGLLTCGASEFQILNNLREIFLIFYKGEIEN